MLNFRVSLLTNILELIYSLVKVFKLYVTINLKKFKFTSMAADLSDTGPPGSFPVFPRVNSALNENLNICNKKV